MFRRCKAAPEVTMILENMPRSVLECYDGMLYYGSALQAAIHRGHDSIAQMLSNFGADPNVGSGYYGNALQAAAIRGNAEQVQTLLEYGADVDAKD